MMMMMMMMMMITSAQMHSHHARPSVGPTGCEYRQLLENDVSTRLQAMRYVPANPPILPPVPNSMPTSLQSNLLKWIALGPDYEYPLRQTIHLSMYLTCLNGTTQMIST